MKPLIANKRNVKDKMEQLTFLLLLLLVTVVFLLLLQPFFAPIFWACATSLLFYPLQMRLAQYWGNKPNLIALSTLFCCVIVVVIPVLLLLSSFASEGASLYARIDSGDINPKAYLARFQEATPNAIKHVLKWLDMDMATLEKQLTSGALAASGFATRNVFSLGQSTFNFLLSIALMLYMTFFLLRDGARLIDLISVAIPLGNDRERLLFSKVAEVTRATIKGTIVVAIVQGALGGFIFWFLHIPVPVLWGVIMAVVSLIPTVGAAIVWLPCSIYLYLAGEVNSALILIVYGSTVISLSDNILRPLLVGRDTKLPDWLVLLSTLGGLVMFGINGFVVGPLIAAVFIVFWQIFSRDYQDENLDPSTVAEMPNGPHIPVLWDEANGSKD